MPASSSLAKRCACQNTDGTQCKRLATGASKFCAQHQNCSRPVSGATNNGRNSETSTRKRAALLQSSSRRAPASSSRRASASSSRRVPSSSRISARRLPPHSPPPPSSHIAPPPSLVRFTLTSARSSSKKTKSALKRAIPRGAPLRSITKKAPKKRVSFDALKIAPKITTISPATSCKPLAPRSLRVLDEMYEIVTFNGEQFSIKQKVVVKPMPVYTLSSANEMQTSYKDTIVLLVEMDYVDASKREAFIATCDYEVRQKPMVVQAWSVKNGALYLEYQENMIQQKDFCTGTAEAARVLRGAARYLWCKFLQNGVARGAFCEASRIEFEVRGCFTECDKKDAYALGMPMLIQYYERLGFRQTGEYSNYILDEEPNVRYPMMASTVGETLKFVCA